MEKNKTTSICFPTAKINFGLRIVGKRTDGYHNIESVFYPIGIHDTLEIENSTNGKSSLEVVNVSIPGDFTDNLIWKTWVLLQQKYNLPHLIIRLVKHIPMGGGVGGGSADVGFFINLINDFFDLKLTQTVREQHALAIGSDCPFFIQNRPQIVTGRGECLQPVTHFLKDLYLVLFFDSVSIRTKEAYENITISVNEASIETLIHSPELWEEKVKNDFEPFVLGKYPALQDIKRKAYENAAIYASLTGTGGCLYALFHVQPNLPEDLKNKVVWEGLLG